LDVEFGERTKGDRADFLIGLFFDPEDVSEMFFGNIGRLQWDYRIIFQKIECFIKNEYLTLCWPTSFSALVFSLFVLRPLWPHEFFGGGQKFMRERENGLGNAAHRDHRAWACGRENLGRIRRPPAVDCTALNFSYVSSYSY
jgi:hypothetical protein